MLKQHWWKPWGIKNKEKNQGQVHGSNINMLHIDYPL
jgi:hypothetical protein